jgi:hypothetical protein
MSERMLPSFIGIGAQRAGTTWAYNCLAEHPQVFMTRKKELHFFYVNYGRGLDWYAEQFAGAEGALARGEITPDYMYHPVAMQNIARDVPDVRLFAILRNPIDRAVSAFALHTGRYAGQSFAHAVATDPELIDRGLYARHLRRVLELFPRERVAILFYDDLVDRPLAFLRDLYAFVGVDPGFRPASLETRYNRVIYPRLQQLLLRCGAGWIIDGVKKTPIGDWVRGRNQGSRRESGVATQADVAKLKAAFADDVAELGRLVGRDLDHWLA